MISAKIIADSTANGIRLTTMELCYHRFIHSEFMTHRLFSRNTSSSRAIPVEKMLKQVEENPAMPIHWGKNQPGMQAKKEIDDKAKARYEWLLARDKMLTSVTHLELLNVHKQVVNRLLEPFQYIKVIVTATEWDNFFALRLHPDAQPEMMTLAEHIKEAMDGSNPEELEHNEWHLPYITNDDWCGFSFGNYTIDDLIKFSVARCARVSYLNHDNSNPNIEKDIALYTKLLEAGHMSPFEHIATPMRYPEGSDFNSIAVEDGITHLDKWGSLWSGNFRGFIQYRQMLRT